LYKSPVTAIFGKLLPPNTAGKTHAMEYDLWQEIMIEK